MMPKQLVGRGHPPKSGQFKKGKSGNPKGRPKGSVNLKTAIEKQLSAPVIVRENGKERKITTAEAVMMKLRADAIAGNQKAILSILKMVEQTASDRADEPSDYTEFDLEVIRRFAPPLLANQREG